MCAEEGYYQMNLQEEHAPKYTSHFLLVVKCHGNEKFN